MQSFSVIKLGSDIKDGKEEETSNDLEDFSSLPNVFELLPRNDHGQWITDVELVDKFNYMQILYNPNVLKHKIIEEINSVRQNVFTHDEKKEILVV